MKTDGFLLASFIYTLCIISAIDCNRHRILLLPRKTCCTQVRKYIVPIAPSLTMQTLLTQLNPETKIMKSVQKYAEPKPTVAPMKKSQVYSTNSDDAETEKAKALLCARITCPSEFKLGPVCACNFNTGNVVSFKNKCDLKKHNCRFDTAFKVILEEICPWEYESRRATDIDEFTLAYDESKYLN